VLAGTAGALARKQPGNLAQRSASSTDRGGGCGARDPRPLAWTSEPRLASQRLRVVDEIRTDRGRSDL